MARLLADEVVLETAGARPRLAEVAWQGAGTFPAPGHVARTVARPRLVLVVNPRVRDRVGAALWRLALTRLGEESAIVATASTRGDAGDRDRIRAVARAARPDVLVAAGGDGTVNHTVEAILAAGAAGEDAPVLGILPLGTANNVARSLGLLSCRHRGARAVELAVRTIASGRERVIDLGAVGARHFVGSFAAGMDADILATRNRWRRVVGARRRLSGYPLYLASCAANLLAGGHGAPSHVVVDGIGREARAYNVLVTNTALYAGEFRFDPGDPSADGTLDLQVMAGPVDYVRRFVGAWRRYLGVERGDHMRPPHGLERMRRATVSCRRPVASQLDGEELCVTDRYEIHVLPRALRVCVPAQTGDGAAGHPGKMGAVRG
jgi:diacylglycerol kinase family enzyme